MDEVARRKWDSCKAVPISWHPLKGGKRALVCFEDDATYDLGVDSDHRRFDSIAHQIMSGRYYPSDAVEFFGPFVDEGRALRKGDRILQKAPILGLFHAWSMVEIYVADLSRDACEIGYVTTECHHGRGIWRAKLTWNSGQLQLNVRSTANPHSWLFWIGLPIARYYQLRARRRAVEEFRKLSS